MAHCHGEGVRKQPHEGGACGRGSCTPLRSQEVKGERQEKSGSQHLLSECREHKQEDPARAIPGQLVTGEPSNTQVTAVMTLPSDGG